MSLPVETQIRAVYVILTIVWIVVTKYMGLWSTKSRFILLFPLLIFSWDFYNASHTSPKVDECLQAGSALSIGIMVAFPMMTWLSKESAEITPLLSKTVLVAMIFSLLTYSDVWIREENLVAYKHYRSALRVMSMALFILVIAEKLSGFA